MKTKAKSILCFPLFGCFQENLFYDKIELDSGANVQLTRFSPVRSHLLFDPLIFSSCLHAGKIDGLIRSPPYAFFLKMLKMLKTFFQKQRNCKGRGNSPCTQNPLYLRYTSLNCQRINGSKTKKHRPTWNIVPHKSVPQSPLSLSLGESCEYLPSCHFRLI